MSSRKHSSNERSQSESQSVESQRHGSQPLPQSHSCFVCGRDNPRGLALEFDLKDGRVTTQCRVDETYGSFEGRLHGGITSALMDEVMGWATAAVTGRFAYTAELTVRFREPVLPNVQIQITGWVDSHSRRLAKTTAEIRSLEAPGEPLLASATAKFMLATQDESAAIEESLIYRPDSFRLSKPPIPG